MTAEHLTTLESIHRAAKAEFLEKGFQSASLRNIVKTAGMTTGAFYGYYKSKEGLFEALVSEHYDFILNRFQAAQREFAALPHEQQPDHLSNISRGDEPDFWTLHVRYAALRLSPSG